MKASQIQLTVLLIGWCLSVLGTAQVVAQTTFNTHRDFPLNNLVKDIFANAACENIDGIQAIGSEEGIGYFEYAQDIIGIDKGIILATGNVNNARGPNNANDAGNKLNENSGDPDLSSLATDRVLDATGLAFDFIPLDSIVSFRYVFASEEYCEFVGSEFNDVFGFFISGPGIEGGFTSGAKNVALIPGSDEFVSINAVNHRRNSEFYIPNETNDGLAECNLPTSIERPHLADFQYDGFTSVFTAFLKLTPCVRYRIRMVVGDVKDHFFDSAVFLEAGSFNLGGQMSVDRYSGSAGGQNLYEGCADAGFRINRSPTSSLDFPQTVNYYLSNDTQASAGPDYAELAGQVVIPEGARSINVPVESLLDEEDEQAELLRLVLDIPCDCYTDSADVYIVTKPPLGVVVDDVSTCPYDEPELTAQVSRGVEPYRYDWSNNEPSQRIVVPSEDGAWHMVTVTDLCGETAIDSAQVMVYDLPEANLSGELDICLGDTASLALALTGEPPFQLTYMLDGASRRYTVRTGNRLPIQGAGTYELLEVTDANCTNAGSGDGVVRTWQLAADADMEAVSCFGGEDGALQVQMQVGLPPFQYNWVHDPAAGERAMALSAGTYAVNVVDARGCTAIFDWEVTQPEPLQKPQVDCVRLASPDYEPSAVGGTAPYQYSINGGTFRTEGWADELEAGKFYQIRIVDANGCELEDDWQVPSSFANGMAMIPEEVRLARHSTTDLDPIWLVDTDLLDSIVWKPSNQLDCFNCLYPTVEARFDQFVNLLVTDIFGCTDSLRFTIRAEDRLDVFVPSAFSPNGDQYNDNWQIFVDDRQVIGIEEILVFNRWGTQVFAANNWPVNDASFNWDGRVNGKLLPNGVYVYTITFRLRDQTLKVKGGDVSILY